MPSTTMLPLPSLGPQRRAPRGAAGLLRAAALLALALLPPAATAASPAAGEVAVGQLLPDALMQGLNGPSRKLSAFRGKPLVINVWASWCGPCRQEMASLERLAWHEAEVPFVVIGISTDDYPDKAKALLRSSNATLSHYIDQALQLENMLGASRLPLTVLVDAGGRVQAKIYGARQWDSAESINLIRNTWRAAARAPGR